MQRILAAMPERSRRTGEWVRTLFTVLWETGLRESTILRLRTPEHYKRGARRLFITEDIDKARYQRSVPLTDAARKALDRVCPREPGVLFAGVDEDSLRHYIEAAAKTAGIERHVSTYDIRHGRASQLANSGAPLAGVARLLGHKHVSTTSKYVHADNDAGWRLSPQSPDAAPASSCFLGAAPGAAGPK